MTFLLEKTIYSLEVLFVCFHCHFLKHNPILTSQITNFTAFSNNFICDTANFPCSHVGGKLKHINLLNTIW